MRGADKTYAMKQSIKRAKTTSIARIFHAQFIDTLGQQSDF
ncbi:hypothetical protein HMPREF1584_00594 [Gardnerella vaginalis JCP8481A]|uniref:Uncharacterized protein n=1 Tax=Gardnerella vaginalis TaxID=2702 RepID=A0A133NZC9_GARVA|nr:hypothetical protein HMPREF1584_00594 [Gardnerella vaginalis JCP8481A]EPI44206.1 hypothetical protein HMPREF1585_00212 [Gardnerella vaginalis JCP8481B]KXA21660.1 hypothetical protein HMPREF3208_00483 [Gardnerella vaginalis]